ncbi:MAG TPA: 2OG-Fe(II) oxygenase [Caulobacteraceae bacterium]|nr:2OG-Fe(II) oxygenase [Caulobacteraceae bacterium]
MDLGAGGLAEAATIGTNSLTEQVKASLCASFANGARNDDPYRHWIVSNVFPAGMPDTLFSLPFPTADLHGVSGKRELHNDTRLYFDAQNNVRYDECGAVADAFQSREVVEAIERHTGADLRRTYVRLEYAQDIDGFWLEPHTDLGVKKFTMLIYLGNGPDQDDLGTDIYRDHETWAKRPAFTPNTALIFVPGDNTWHGFERREIKGVRKSVIMNYVTDDWRAREQLAYPTTPVK